MVRGVVLGGLAERPSGDQAAYNRDGKAVRVVEGVAPEHPSGEHDGGYHGEGHGHVGAHVERLGKCLRICGVAALDEERTEDRGDHPDEGDRHREHEQGDRHLLGGGFGGEPQGERHQGDRGEDRPGVRLEQVGTHAGHVAHVVAHVVGDGGRVAGVVLGDAGLHLADQVGTDVGGLGVDATTNPAEQGDRAGAEAVGGQDLECLVDLEDEHEQDVDEHQAGKGQARNAEAHDSTATEGDRQRLAGPVLGRLGGPCVCHRGHGHADIAGDGRQHGTGHVGDGGGWHDQHTDQERHHHDEAGDPDVLLLQERTGALLDLGHQVDHPVVARIGRLHVGVEVPGEQEAEDGRGSCQVGDRLHETVSSMVGLGAAACHPADAGGCRATRHQGHTIRAGTVGTLVIP